MQSTGPIELKTHHEDVILNPKQPGLNAMVALVGKLPLVIHVVGLQILSHSGFYNFLCVNQKAKFDFGLWVFCQLVCIKIWFLQKGFCHRRL